MNNLQAFNLTQICLFIAFLIYIIYKQIALRPVKPGKYIILPIIFFYLAINAISGLGGEISADIAPMIFLASIGIISGISSGMITKIFKGDDGILYQKGGIAAALFLLVTIPMRYILRHSISSFPSGEIFNNTGISYLIMLSSQLISRSLTVLIRCPEVWTSYIKQRKNKKKKVS